MDVLRERFVSCPTFICEGVLYVIFNCITSGLQEEALKSKVNEMTLLSAL